MDLKEPYNLITDKLAIWYEQLVKILPNALVAFLVLIVFFMMAKVIKSLVGKFVKRMSDDHYINKFAVNGAFIITIIAGLLVALNILNLDKAVTSFLAGAGIIGLALAFAFQETATNLMAGIILIVRKPIKIGDHIKVSGEQGNVQEVSLRTTKIQTFDGQLVLVPNKDVFQGVVKNYSHTASRRVEIAVGVSYGDDLNKAEDILKKTLINLDHIDKERGVDVFYTDFGDSSINLTARYWLPNGFQSEFLKSRSSAIKLISQTFNDNDISIPFPIRTLDFDAKGGKTLNTQLTNNSKG